MVQSVGFFSPLKGRFEGLCYPVSWEFVVKNLPCLQAKQKNRRTFQLPQLFVCWRVDGMVHGWYEEYPLCQKYTSWSMINSIEYIASFQKKNTICPAAIQKKTQQNSQLTGVKQTLSFPKRLDSLWSIKLLAGDPYIHPKKVIQKSSLVIPNLFSVLLLYLQEFIWDVQALNQHSSYVYPHLFNLTCYISSSFAGFLCTKNGKLPTPSSRYQSVTSYLPAPRWPKGHQYRRPVYQNQVPHCQS